MKNFKSYVMAIAAICVIISSLIYLPKSQERKVVTPSMLKNIEALTQGESSSVACFNDIRFPSSVFDLTIRVRVCSPCGVYLSVVYAGDSRTC